MATITFKDGADSERLKTPIADYLGEIKISPSSI
jgi:hypothetical protein